MSPRSHRLPWLLLSAVSFSSCADDRAPLDWTRGAAAPVVVGFDRFHRRVAAAPAGGRLLLGDLGCTHCHAATRAQQADLTPKEAPRLTAVARRMHHTRLREWIASPRLSKPGTTMPDVWRGVSASDRQRDVEALTHYLSSLAPGGVERVHTDDAAARRGAALFHEVGCAACHAPDRGPAPEFSVPLPEMANLYAVDEVARFLEDPLSVRPSGRMPSLGLSRKEALDVSHSLLRGTRTAGALRYERYDVPLEGLAELAMESPAPTATGVTDAFDLKVASRRYDYALVFSGFVEVPAPGAHTFHLRSDDGSRLVLEGEQLVEIAGRARENAVREMSATRELQAGWHEITVEYFQRGGEARLAVEWEGPGFERSEIPAAALRHTLEELRADPPLGLDPSLIRRGEEVFAARGCANCHRRPESADRVEARALSDVDPRRGCLSEDVPAGAPDFGLDAGQRFALRAALRELAEPGIGAALPERRIDHAMKTWSCYACHARAGVGGVTEDRDASFLSRGEDLGEEGRIPPDLTGVGDRLRPEWLHFVLSTGRPVRPYLATRMPRFGEANVGHLGPALVSVDRLPDRPTPIDGPGIAESREVGRALVGEGALACILCHDFNRRAAQTMSVIDLVTTTERLRPDWFERYVIDPEKTHPGTRMPSFWPLGVSTQPDVLDGNTRRQIAAIWAYLSDGARARDPDGLDRKGVELVVGGDAVVYRGKLWEAGWRAIAVGYPERVNLAFDAEEVRLSLLWKERFLDVSAHWTRQGMGRVRPHGTDVVVLPHGPPIAALADADAPWPTVSSREAGFRFRGYDLDDRRRPTFRYAFGAIEVEDTPRPTSGPSDGVVLERVLVVTADEPTDDLWMRVATGTKIAPADDGGFLVDDRLTLRFKGESDRAPHVRATGDGAELRFPLDVAAGSNRVIVRYAW